MRNSSWKIRASNEVTVLLIFFNKFRERNIPKIFDDDDNNGFSFLEKKKESRGQKDRSFPQVISPPPQAIGDFLRGGEGNEILHPILEMNLKKEIEISRHIRISQTYNHVPKNDPNIRHQYRQEYDTYNK